MVKPPKPKEKQFVECMKCENYDHLDEYCIAYHKDIWDPYPERFTCRRYQRTH